MWRTVLCMLFGITSLRRAGCGRRRLATAFYHATITVRLTRPIDLNNNYDNTLGPFSQNMIELMLRVVITLVKEAILRAFFLTSIESPYICVIESVVDGYYNVSRKLRLLPTKNGGVLDPRHSKEVGSWPITSIQRALR